MNEKYETLDEKIIALAIGKGYRPLKGFEPTVDRVVDWLFRDQRLHIYTKLKKFPDGEYWFHYCIQDVGFLYGVQRASLDFQSTDGYREPYNAIYYGVLNILENLTPINTL